MATTRKIYSSTGYESAWKTEKCTKVVTKYKKSILAKLETI